MKRANNELTTARNTPNPIVAAGKDDAPVSGTSPIALTSNQGLAINLCRDSHHATMTPIGARHAVIVGPAIDLSLKEIKSGRIHHDSPDDSRAEVNICAFPTFPQDRR